MTACDVLTLVVEHVRQDGLIVGQITTERDLNLFASAVVVQMVVEVASSVYLAGEGEHEKCTDDQMNRTI